MHCLDRCVMIGRIGKSVMWRDKGTALVWVLSRVRFIVGGEIALL